MPKSSFKGDEAIKMTFIQTNLVYILYKHFKVIDINLIRIMEKKNNFMKPKEFISMNKNSESCMFYIACKTLVFLLAISLKYFTRIISKVTKI